MNNSDLQQTLGVASPGVAPKTDAERRLTIRWSWDCELTIGPEIIPLTGHCWTDFAEDPIAFGKELQICDEWLDLQVEGQIHRFLRARLLRKPASPGGLESPPGADVPVRFQYQFKVWSDQGRAFEINGTKETVIRLDRQLLGHLMMVKRTFGRSIFNGVRAKFRYLALDWIKTLPSSASTEAALGLVNRQLEDLLLPDTVEPDQLPKAIRDIEVIPRQRRI